MSSTSVSFHTISRDFPDHANFNGFPHTFKVRRLCTKAWPCHMKHAVGNTLRVLL